MVNPDNRTNEDMRVRRQTSTEKVGSTPPANAPKSNKSFKTVFTENEVTDDKALIESQAEASGVLDELQESPATLFKKLAKSKARKESALKDSTAFDLHELKASSDEEIKIKRLVKERDAQPDMNSVYPGLGLQSDHAKKIDLTQTQSVDLQAHIDKIEALLKRIVEEVNVIRQNGLTKTEVTLMNIKDFEGAKLTLTNYDSDAKRLDIAFTNLSAEAKQLLDAHMLDLRKQLEMNHGYSVNVFVTTLKEEPIKTTSSEESKQSSSDDRYGGGGGDKKKDQDSDKEES